MMGGRIFEFDGRYEQRDGQLFLSGRGLYGDGFTSIRTMQPHGFFSIPPAGAQGMMLYPNGNPDEAYLMGLAHHQSVPTGLVPGNGAIYDHTGQIIKLIDSGMVVDTVGKTITITSGAWTLNAPNLTINSNVQLNGNLNCTGTIIDGDGNNGA